MNHINAKDVVKSAKWVASVKLLSQLASFITTIIVLRFISKDSFGLASMAFIVMGFIDAIIDFGFTAALVQKKEVSKKEYSSCFWGLILFSSVITIIMFFASPLVGVAYNDMRVNELVQVLVLTFLAIPIQVVYKGILTREFKLDQIAKLDFIGLLSRSSVTLLLAVNGFGVWSLIIGFMSEKFIVAILLIFTTRWLPLLFIGKEELQPFIKFGMNITFSRIVYYFLYRVDSMVVGRIFGTEVLGVYTIALQFINVVSQLIITTSNKILFPLFSRYQESNKLLDLAYKAIRLIAVIALPAIAGLALISRDLIGLALGESWSIASDYLRLLAIVAGFQVITSIIPQIFNAVNRPEINVKLNLGALMIYSFVLYGAAYLWGMNGILVASIMLAILRFVVILIVAKYVVLIEIKLVLKEVLEVVFTITMLIGIELALIASLPEMSAIYRMLLVIVAGVVIYCGVQYIFFRKKIHEIYQLLARV